jgi:ABC-type sugar transport system permease subunit
MKNIIKKYRYIIILSIVFLFLIWICCSNYSIIEKYTCRSSISFPPINYTQFKPMNTGGYSPVTYYNYKCANDDDNDCTIGFYTPSLTRENSTGNGFIKFINKVEASGNTIQEKLDHCAKRANESPSPIDFFALNSDDAGNDCYCNLYSLTAGNLRSLKNDVDSLIIKSIDLPRNCNSLDILKNKNIPLPPLPSNNTDISYVGIGFGAFTTRGYNEIRKSSYLVDDDNFLRYYDPLCDSQTAFQKYTDAIKSCNTGKIDGSRTPSDCDSLLNNYNLIAGNMNTTLGGINFIGSHTDNTFCNNGNCITQSFDDGNYLGNAFSQLSANTITEISYNQYNTNVSNYNESLAKVEESKLKTISTSMIYLLLVVVLIITLIMFFLNITNSDIITAEILIGYIIFIVIIVFFTSKFFNVDYGVFNQFFSLQLGESGSRSVF